MIEYLKGKKTYIVGSLAIVYAVIGFAIGQIDSVTALAFIFAALGGMGVRNGLTTEAQKLLSLVPDKTLPSQTQPPQ